MKKFFFLLICVVILVPLAWVLTYRFEGTPPEVEVDLPSLYLKDKLTLSLDVKDMKTGLREVQVRLVQQEIEKTLMEKTYPAGSVFSPFSGEIRKEDQLDIPVEANRHGLSDGKAMLHIQVSDLSWRGWNRGNIAEKNISVFIDTLPPKIEVLSRQHNVERGGTGLVIYKLFEPDVKSGVMVGDRFFRVIPGCLIKPRSMPRFLRWITPRGPAPGSGSQPKMQREIRPAKDFIIISGIAGLNRMYSRFPIRS